jgi:hypothetical protein
MDLETTVKAVAEARGDHELVRRVLSRAKGTVEALAVKLVDVCHEHLADKSSGRKARRVRHRTVTRCEAAMRQYVDGGVSLAGAVKTYGPALPQDEPKPLVDQ